MSKGIYAPVDGSARKVTKLYAGVNMLPSVGNLPVGATVKLNVAGEPKDFIVVHQGNPDPSMYDDSCDGTWLLLKHPYENKKFSADVAYINYLNSDIHTYLNGTFLGRFDANVQAAIKTVKLPISSDTLRENGFSTKVFLLSARELGFISINTNYVDYGWATKLDYFLEGIGEAARSLRIATKEDGVRIDYWLRSIYAIGAETQARYIANYNIGTPGNLAAKAVSSTAGVRPAIILPFETGVTAGLIDGAVAENYTFVARKIKKVYGGDENGIARLCWSLE